MVASPSNSEILEVHYNYEINMIVNSFHLIGEYQTRDRPQPGRSRSRNYL